MASIPEIILVLSHAAQEGRLHELEDVVFDLGGSSRSIIGNSATLLLAPFVGVKDIAIDLAEKYFEKCLDDSKPNFYVQDESAQIVASVGDIRRLVTGGRYGRRYRKDNEIIGFYIKHRLGVEQNSDPSAVLFSAVAGTHYIPPNRIIYNNRVITNIDASEHLDFFIYCCERTKPFYGVSGLSLIFGSYFAPAQQAFYPVLARFPGLGQGDLSSFVSTIRGRRDVIRDVGWLTAVDDANLERVGGRAALRSKSGSDVIVHEYDGGIVLQAGELPRLGDVNRGEVPSPYREVARLLRPLRLTDYDPPGFLLDVPDGVDARDATMRYINRFD